jgi:hypothetical protein
MTEGDADLDQHIARVVDSLTERFSGTHDRQAVEQAVLDARAHLASDAPVTNYIPILVTRRAIDHLAGRRQQSSAAPMRLASEVQRANEVLRPVVQSPDDDAGTVPAPSMGARWTSLGQPSDVRAPG